MVKTKLRNLLITKGYIGNIAGCLKNQNPLLSSTIVDKAQDWYHER